MEGLEGVGRYAATVAAALALAVGVATSGCGSDSEAVATSDPLAEFAPIVRFAEDERWYPMGARWFIDRSVLRWAANFECPDPKLAAGAETRAATTRALPEIRTSGLGKGPPYRFSQTTSDCRPVGPKKFLANEFNRPYDRKIGVNDEGFYLNLNDAARRGQQQPRRAGERLLVNGVPGYTDSTKLEVDGEHGLKLSYWLLYGMHESGEYGPRFWEPTHEGDWERLDVIAKRHGDEEYEPVAIRYRWEGRRRETPWDEIEHAGQHPVMQAERGTHQMKPATDTACADCAEWDTWTNLERLDQQDWEGFGGAWGFTAPTVTGTGPVGPHGGHGLPDVHN